MSKHKHHPSALPSKLSQHNEQSKLIKEIRNLNPKAEEELTIRTDNIIIMGDIHANYLDEEVFAMVLRFARQNKIKTIVLAGDVINADAFGVFAKIQPPQNFNLEVRQANLMFAALAKCFDKIYWICGNHDRRIAKIAFGELTIDHIADIVCGTARKKTIVTQYSRMWVEAKTGVWLIAHQKNYSRVKLSVARALASKYGCHVICAHQHHCAVGVSDDGKHVVVDLPCSCHLPPYKLLETSTMPEWCRGFGYIIRGKYGSWVKGLPM